jgi:TPR repeat protein
LYLRAAELLRAATDAGHAVAAAWLSRCYWNGHGVEKSQTESQRFARAALDERGLQALADQGDPAAQGALGSMYNTGTGLRQDKREALVWWRKAADQGDASAQRALGFAYYDGKGVDQNHPEAVSWWRKAVEQGGAAAQGALGEAYRDGKGVDQSHPEAVAWFRKSAEQGDATAQYRLGEAYRDGDGVDQSHHEAVAWWRKGAAQRDAWSQCSLGFAYQGGEGVNQSHHEAVAWWRKAADQGDATAQHALGHAYRDGAGVDQSHPEAVAWFRKSAAQGDATAQVVLGYACRDGTGVDRDECKAVQWFQKAAQQGHEDAQRVLREWDTTLADIAASWQVVYDPDPRATAVEADQAKDWVRGSSADDEGVACHCESYEDAGVLRRMSPWVVRCELNRDTLENKGIATHEVRGMAEEACRECGCCDVNVVTSSEGYEADGAWRWTLRARVLASAEPASDDMTSLSQKRGADDASAGGRRSSGSTPTVQPQEVRELTVCRPDGTSHKLAVSLSTTVLEVKQHVRRTAGCGANAADAEEERALPFRPFCWQDDLKDEHAARRQYVYEPGNEDELADVQTMASLGNPLVLFLILGTEELLMDRLEAEAVALRGRLEGVKLRDLARCDNANMMEEARAVEEAGGTGAGSGLPCKKHRAH